MKLYTTTTSERGKPAHKGGNNFVIISLHDKTRDCVLKVRVEVSDVGLPIITRIDSDDYIMEQLAKLIVCNCHHCKRMRKLKMTP